MLQLILKEEIISVNELYIQLFNNTMFSKSRDMLISDINHKIKLCSKQLFLLSQIRQENNFKVVSKLIINSLVHVKHLNDG